MGIPTITYIVAYMAEKFSESKSGGKEKQVAWEAAELIVDVAWLPVTLITFLIKDLFSSSEK